LQKSLLRNGRAGGFFVGCSLQLSHAVVVNWWFIQPLKKQASMVSMSRTPMRKIRIRPLFAALTLMFLHVVAAVILSAQNSPAEPESFRQASEAMRRGDLNAAGEGFEAATKASPSFAPAHFNLGLVREEQGRFDEAIASLQKALSLRPGMHGANLFLGIAYYRMNRFEPAIAAVKKETSVYPKDASAWMWQGVIALAMDHAEDAAAALDKAASLAPDSVDILYHRGQAHLLVSKNSYLEMFKADPKSWRVHQVLAQASAQAERPLDAIAEYQEAIKLAPMQPGLHEELGSEYSIAAKPLDAEAAFQRELEIDPHNVLARYKLGVLYIAQGDGARAKGLIEAAANQKAGLRHLDYNLGRAEMLLGNDAAAAQHLELATSAPGADSEVIELAWYQLGVVYRHLHRMQDAQKAMATFQKLKDQEAKQNPSATQPPPSPENPQ
jgi:tetratricopeptide (TPR) repeat protein